MSKYNWSVIFICLCSSVDNYLVHVPAVEILQGGESIASFMVVILAVAVAVIVVAPTPVVGETVAAKQIAAGEVKSFKYMHLAKL